MFYRLLGSAVLTAFLLFSATTSAQEEATKNDSGAMTSGWQVQANIPSNMPPAISWDCFELPATASDFARSYVELMYSDAGCKIGDEVTGGNAQASLTLICSHQTMRFDFKITSETTMSVNNIVVNAAGDRTQYLTLFKQWDATVEFDCSVQGQAAWHATRPPEAVNYSCDESRPPAIDAQQAKHPTDFGFPIEMKTFKVVLNRPGEDVDNGLPEQCNWYEVDGEEFCYTPTALELFVDNPHALSLADIAIELRVGEREFSGSAEYCEDVKALAAQMPWKKGVSCETDAGTSE